MLSPGIVVVARGLRGRVQAYVYSQQGLQVRLPSGDVDQNEIQPRSAANICTQVQG